MKVPKFIQVSKVQHTQSDEITRREAIQRPIQFKLWTHKIRTSTPPQTSAEKCYTNMCLPDIYVLSPLFFIKILQGKNLLITKTNFIVKAMPCMQDRCLCFLRRLYPGGLANGSKVEHLESETRDARPIHSQQLTLVRATRASVGRESK